MASRAELEEALIAADQAGDVEAATVIAQELAKSSGAPSAEGDGAKSAVRGAIGAAALGGGAFVASRLLKRFFPGLAPKRSAVRKLVKSMSDDGLNFTQEFDDYLKHAQSTDRPITFADWVASKPGSDKFKSMEVIRQASTRGTKPADLFGKLDARDMGTRDRVLQSLSQELGVPASRFGETLEEITKRQSDTAKPLYEAAFANKAPIHDTRLMELLNKHAPSMEAALEHAKEAFKYDPAKQVQLQTRAAVSGPRKDAWKFWNVDTVPEYLNVGDPKNGLQTYIDPNIETFDRMKRALWSLADTRGKQGMGDVGAIHSARRELTELLDEIGPAEYKAARQAFAGEEKLKEAADLGMNVFKQKNPTELFNRITKMAPTEMEAFGRGFYEAMQDQNTAALLRKFVSDPQRYPKENEILGAVFTDPNAKQAFISSMSAENMMDAGERALMGSSTPSQQGGIGSAIGHRVADKVLPGSGSLLDIFPNMLKPSMSKRMNRSVADIAFSSLPGNSSIHPAEKVIKGGLHYTRPGALESAATIGMGGLGYMEGAHSEEDDPNALRIIEELYRRR